MFLIVTGIFVGMKSHFVLIVSLFASVLSRTRSDESPKIVGGEEVVKGRYPYQVAFFFSPNGYLPSCGGSLVAPDWVLTAAHCKLREGYAVIGRHDFDNSSETGYETIEILWQKKHPDYDAWTLDNDFMMMKLATNSIFEPVALDTGSTDVSSGADVTVMGWVSDGRTDDKEQRTRVCCEEAAHGSLIGIGIGIYYTLCVQK